MLVRTREAARACVQTLKSCLGETVGFDVEHQSLNALRFWVILS